MKHTITFSLTIAALALVLPVSALAYTPNYYYVPAYQYGYAAPSNTAMNERELADHLRRLIADLQSQLNARTYAYTYTYQTPTYVQADYRYEYDYGSGSYVIGKPRPMGSSRNDDRYRNDYDEEPVAYTENATNIDRNEARIRGEVRMNDFRNGEVFFVYGTDRALIEDVEDDADSYADISTRGDRLGKVRISSNASGNRDYETRISGLSRDREYYFRICVGYEDDRGRDTLTCGNMLRFSTDR